MGDGTGWQLGDGEALVRGIGSGMKAETMLAELNRLRKDLDEDQGDIEWLTLHHAFCFISYKMGDFQKYLDEEAAKGSFEEFDG